MNRSGGKETDDRTHQREIMSGVIRDIWKTTIRSHIYFQHKQQKGNQVFKTNKFHAHVPVLQGPNVVWNRDGI